tara:strand:- start:9727 stop:10794 length:1068 start_codon:yes stop_codon:yes gene_type:complete
MINLAIVPKIHKSIEYSSAFGSQHDHEYLSKIINKFFITKNMNAKIIYLDNFLSKFLKFNFINYNKLKNFDAILFIGINKKGYEFSLKNKNKKLYLWSFNQLEWINSPEKLKNFNIIFEQSERFHPKLNIYKNKVLYTPLGFQEDRPLISNDKSKFDICFIGTLDRSRRNTNLYHRRDILLGLLKKGLTVVNFNGRYKSRVEKQLLSSLIKYPNFKLVKEFGDINDYNNGRYNLNLPFHEMGSKENLSKNWGITKNDLENGNWLIHWDLWRCIGSRSNIITFDCVETRSLGLNNHNCSFYTSNTDNITQLVEEIHKIVKQNIVKKVDEKCWESNTFIKRWEFISAEIIRNIQEKL